MCIRSLWSLTLLCVLCGVPTKGLPESAAPAAERAYYVAPDGDDGNPGTEAKPFKTIPRARDAVRSMKKKLSGDLVVILRGGTYPIADTIVFDHRDSGENGHVVIYRSYPGEVSVISGGRKTTGWRPDSGGRWKAHTPLEDFRQLYVNGVRAARAKGPPPPGIELHGEDGYRIARSNITIWKNPGDVEFCYYVQWTHSRCKVSEITAENSRTLITMLQPHFSFARTKEGVRVNLPTHIENALELLDEPGEWYLDRQTHAVYYIPRNGENMRTADVIAPAVERLMELRGTLDQPVHDIRFEGITFAHGNWLQPSEIGHADVQANFLLDPDRLMKRDGFVTTPHNEHLKSPSNIVCRAARFIRFERCIFTKLGSGGLDLEHGSQDNIISGCEFHDISGTAIQIGDVLENDHHPNDQRLIVKNNLVANNTIHDVALDYKGGVGIFAGYTEGTIIAHNEICNLPYSGISVGWGWGEEDAGGGAPHYYQPFRYDTPTPARNNRIEHNHIHHVMQALNDGGGIYTLSNQPGTIIRGNHVHDNRGWPGGIYLDEGSGFIEVTGNSVYNVNTAMNFNNRAQNRTATCKVHDNFFDVRPGDDAPANVQAELGQVLQDAGLEPPYRKSRSPKPGAQGVTRTK